MEIWKGSGGIQEYIRQDIKQSEVGHSLLVQIGMLSLAAQLAPAPANLESPPLTPTTPPAEIGAGGKLQPGLPVHALLPVFSKWVYATKPAKSY